MITIRETTTRLIVTGNIDELKVLAKALRFRPKNYFRSPKYLLWRDTEGEQGWDGYIKPLWVDFKTNSAEIGRGYLAELVQLCEVNGIEIKYNILPRPFADLTVEDVPEDLTAAPFPLDGNQLEAVVQWLRHGYGIHKVTVGGGKTLMFCAAAAMIKRKYPTARFLYFTPTERLVKQVTTEAKRFLPDWDITQFGGGKRNFDGKDMVVATNGALGVNFKKLYKDGWFKTFMGFLIDEAQGISSPTVSNILLHSPAYFRLAASDTTRDAKGIDGLEDPSRYHQIKALVGGVQVIVEAGPMIESGRLAKPTIYLVDKLSWAGRFRKVKHVAEIDSDAWVLVEGTWMKGTYLGPVYEVDDQGDYKLAKKKLSAADVLEVGDKWKDPNTKEVHEVNHDWIGERIGLVEGDHQFFRMEKIQVPGLHTVQVKDEIMEYPSRLCLLDRTQDRAIIQFRDRNEIALEWTAHWADTHGYQTLVVATRSIHVAIFKQMAIDKFGADRVRSLTSDDSTATRNKTFKWFEENKGSILVSSIVKVGVSLNFINAGVLLDYTGGWELANQIVGRFIRPKQVDNTAHITMFLERQHPTLFQGSFQVYEKLKKIRGYRYVHPVVHPSDIAEAPVHEVVKVT